MNILRLTICSTLLALLGGCTTTESHRSTGAVIDDTTISSRIKTALLADKTTDGLDIEIEINQGRVQLNGFADSNEEVLRAEEIAKNTSGVSSVTNNLRVAEGSRTVGRYVDDKLLVARINRALAKDPLVKVLDIEVEVNRGIVMLGGYVERSEQRSAAVEAARGVDGVERVINNLEIR